jgi:hypothetical protein
MSVHIGVDLNDVGHRAAAGLDLALDCLQQGARLRIVDRVASGAVGPWLPSARSLADRVGSPVEWACTATTLVSRLTMEFEW